MTPTHEIIVTRSMNGHCWACYAGHENILSDPNGYGPTEEQARTNLAIDEAYIAKHGNVYRRFPDLLAEVEG